VRALSCVPASGAGTIRSGHHRPYSSCLIAARCTCTCGRGAATPPAILCRGSPSTPRHHVFRCACALFSEQLSNKESRYMGLASPHPSMQMRHHLLPAPAAKQRKGRNVYGSHPCAGRGAGTRPLPQSRRCLHQSLGRAPNQAAPSHVPRAGAQEEGITSHVIRGCTRCDRWVHAM